MPVSRISSVSLFLSPSFVTLQIFASLKKIYVSRQKLFSRTSHKETQKNGIKTLMAKNSRHCDGENDDDDDDGGKNYGTSH